MDENRNISSEIISLYFIDCFAAKMPAMVPLVEIKVLSDSLLRAIRALGDDWLERQPESRRLQRS